MNEWSLYVGVLTNSHHKGRTLFINFSSVRAQFTLLHRYWDHRIGRLVLVVEEEEQRKRRKRRKRKKWRRWRRGIQRLSERGRCGDWRWGPGTQIASEVGGGWSALWGEWAARSEMYLTGSAPALRSWLPGWCISHCFLWEKEGKRLWETKTRYTLKSPLVHPLKLSKTATDNNPFAPIGNRLLEG